MRAAVAGHDPGSARGALRRTLSTLRRAVGEEWIETTGDTIALRPGGGSSMWADLDHEAGRPDESMSHLKRAVAIFSEVGADEATRLPEIWKLVSW